MAWPWTMDPPASATPLPGRGAGRGRGRDHRTSLRGARRRGVGCAEGRWGGRARAAPPFRVERSLLSAEHSGTRGRTGSGTESETDRLKGHDTTVSAITSLRPDSSLLSTVSRLAARARSAERTLDGGPTPPSSALEARVRLCPRVGYHLNPRQCSHLKHWHAIDEQPAPRTRLPAGSSRSSRVAARAACPGGRAATRRALSPRRTTDNAG